MRRFLLIFLLSPSMLSWANDSTKVRMKVSGFVNTQLFYDTRKTVNGREALLMLYPEREVLDAHGEDKNAVPQFNQLGMISRLTVALTGPPCLGAKTTALLEADFSGQTNSHNNGFRLRHAYIRMQWQRASLLLGQYWHPMNVIEAVPSILALSTGAPMRPFSRHPQIRFDYRMNRWTLIAVAASQRDYASEGPQGNSSLYMRQGIIPNLHLQGQYRKNYWFFSFGLDYKRLLPSTEIFGLKSNKGLHSWAGEALAQFLLPNLDLKFQMVYGQNMSEHVLLGGYWQTLHPLEGTVTYNNTAQQAVWIDLSTRNAHWNVGLFYGCAIHFDPYGESAPSSMGVFYGRGENLMGILRGAPRVTYARGPLVLGFEPDVTTALYFEPRIERQEVRGVQTVSNIRFLLSATYNF